PDHRSHPADCASADPAGLTLGDRCCPSRPLHAQTGSACTYQAETEQAESGPQILEMAHSNSRRRGSRMDSIDEDAFLPDSRDGGGPVGRNAPRWAPPAASSTRCSRSTSRICRTSHCRARTSRFTPAGAQRHRCQPPRTVSVQQPQQQLPPPGCATSSCRWAAGGQARARHPPRRARASAARWVVGIPARLPAFRAFNGVRQVASRLAAGSQASQASPHYAGLRNLGARPAAAAAAAACSCCRRWRRLGSAWTRRSHYSSLGRCGLRVSCLGLGTWVTFAGQVPGKLGWRRTSLTLAYACGINFFDTAEVYAAGRGRAAAGPPAAKGRLAPLLLHRVSTKIFWGGQGGETERGLSRKPHRGGGPAGLPAAAAAGLCGHCVRQPAGPAHPHGGDRAAPSASASTAAGPSTGGTSRWSSASAFLPFFSTFIFLFDVLDIVERHSPPTGSWSPMEIMEAHSVARQFNLIPPVEYHMFQREKLELQMPELFAKAGPGRRGLEPVGLRHSVRRQLLLGCRDKILSEEGRQQQAKLKELAEVGDPPWTARWPSWPSPGACGAATPAACCWARARPSSCTRTSAPCRWWPKLTAALMAEIDRILGAGCGAGAEWHWLSWRVSMQSCEQGPLGPQSKVGASAFDSSARAKRRRRTRPGEAPAQVEASPSVEGHGPVMSPGPRLSQPRMEASPVSHVSQEQAFQQRRSSPRPSTSGRPGHLGQSQRPHKDAVPQLKSLASTHKRLTTGHSRYSGPPELDQRGGPSADPALSSVQAAPNSSVPQGEGLRPARRQGKRPRAFAPSTVGWGDLPSGEEGRPQAERGDGLREVRAQVGRGPTSVSAMWESFTPASTVGCFFQRELCRGTQRTALLQRVSNCPRAHLCIAGRRQRPAAGQRGKKTPGVGGPRAGRRSLQGNRPASPAAASRRASWGLDGTVAAVAPPSPQGQGPVFGTRTTPSGALDWFPGGQVRWRTPCKCSGPRPASGSLPHMRRRRLLALLAREGLAADWRASANSPVTTSEPPPGRWVIVIPQFAGSSRVPKRRLRGGTAGAPETTGRARASGAAFRNWRTGCHLQLAGADPRATSPMFFKMREWSRRVPGLQPW
uniref:Aldo_ket_red domain-containing protein n=1 Tax=Macrostomum lignano TaxID=282301 RepID=A0A1I8IZ65_9PLAT